MNEHAERLPPPGRDEVVAALAAATRLGPYFATTVPGPSAHRRADGCPGETGMPGRSGLPGTSNSSSVSGASLSRTLADLYSDRSVLDAAIGDMAARLGWGERRVAASTFFLGHAARVWGVALGAWTSSGIVPHLDPHSVRWRVVPGQPVELEVTTPAGCRVPVADVDTAVEAIGLAVVDAHLRPFADAVHRGTATAVGLLWGNAASSLVGAVQVLGSRGDVIPETALASVHRLAARLLARPPLAGTTRHRLDSAGRLVPGSVVRRSCCLFYRVPNGGTCGDCPLTGSPAATRRQQRQ